jgi:hypothetical protein
VLTPASACYSTTSDATTDNKGLETGRLDHQMIQVVTKWGPARVCCRYTVPESANTLIIIIIIIIIMNAHAEGGHMHPTAISHIPSS